MSSKRGHFFRRLLFLSGLLYEKPVFYNTSVVNKVGSRADKLMISDHLYLDPALTISKLARIAGTNRSYLSYFIRECKGCTFREYVNSMRARHAFELLRSEKMHCLSDLAIECGFSNLRSLNRSYKAFYGKLPSQERRDFLRENSTIRQL
ncbi:MAG: helix-turn-helix domain-containing protein [Bacteroidales bacterium]|nr:helix-turn-helix domain-containing protein [Bacteroidales bacterium]